MIFDQLAQWRFPFGAEDIVYLVIIGLSILGGLGKKLRDQYQKSKPPEKSATPKAPPPPPVPGKPSAGPEPARRLSPSDAEVILAELFDLPVPGKRRRASGQAPAKPPQGPPPRPAPVARPSGQRPPRRAKPPARTQRGPAPPARPPVPEAAVPRRPAPLDARRADEPPAPESFQEAQPPISRDELRRAIIMNEVLGPPVALRDPSMSW